MIRSLGCGSFVATSLLWACAGPAGTPANVGAARTEQRLPDTAVVAPNLTLEPGALATVRGAPVEHRTGAGGRPFEVARRSALPEGGHARRFGSITLPLALRSTSPTLTQYPCEACHFGRTVVMGQKRIGDAHQNVKPIHPSLSGAQCSTCHAPENVGLLALQGGGRATVDQSYELCGQCHSRQAEAWAGGGHGKRLDGWQGRRVVMACTDCHDPHNPGVQPRIPFRAPRIERARGTSR